jgi:predicted nucleic acid-binding protein
MPDRKELVINTGPLIALVAAASNLEILRGLYSRVIVPFEVCGEIITGGSTGFAVPEFQAATFLEKRSTPTDISAFLTNSLDPGEASVIQTALDLRIATVCIDEAVGRRIARLNALAVTGSIGIMLRAKQQGVPLSLRTALDSMRRHGIWVGKEVADAALKQAGE